VKKIAIALSALICAIPAMAQEHLDPDDTVVGQLLPDAWHGSDYAREFKPAFDGSERVFAVIEPSFVREFVIGLRQVSGGYRIFGAWPALTRDKRRIPEVFGVKPPVLVGADGKPLPKDEADMRLADMPTPNGEVRLERCEAPIDSVLADRVIAAWDKVVLQTRADSGMPRFGPDGAVEHFVSHLRFLVVSGKSWSPQPPGNPGWLSRAAEAMLRICDSGRTEPLAQARRELEAAINNIH
jgi:hypothetical protein